MQVREVINRMRTEGDKRKGIVSDLYKLHCEGLKFLFTFFRNYLLTVMKRRSCFE